MKHLLHIKRNCTPKSPFHSLLVSQLRPGRAASLVVSLSCLMSRCVGAPALPHDRYLSQVRFGTMPGDVRNVIGRDVPMDASLRGEEFAIQEEVWSSGLIFEFDESRMYRQNEE